MRLYKLTLLFILLALCYTCNDEVLGNEFFDDNTEVIPDNFLDNFGNDTEADFFGRVFNEDKEPLAGVTLTLGNEVVVTNNQGIFSFIDAPVKEKFAHIKASKAGYISSSRSVTPNENGNLVEIMLFNLDDAITIESGVNQQISLTNGATILFDGNFVNNENTPYSGVVDVYFNYLSPNDADIALQMPGMLVGQRESGALRTLETFGMISVELRGASGEELQLAEGSTAQITMPSGSSPANAPATIPLWSFNEDTGYWVEEGEATLQGNTYVGEVSHFSFWNLDFPIETVYLCINLVDVNGNPLAYTPVNLYSPRLNLVGTYGYSDAQGQECGLVPKDDQMFLVIPGYTCDDENYSQLIGPFTDDTTIDIVVEDPNITSTTLTAQFNSCEGAPLENGYVEVSFSFEENSFAYPIFPFSQGEFSLNVYYCDSGATYNLKAINTETNQRSESFSGDLISPITNLGDIELCQDAPNEIVALDDILEVPVIITESQGITDVINVIANDRINGQLIEDFNLVTITPIEMPEFFTLREDGFVDVIENTPTGNYQFSYQLCETASPENCTSALVAISVTNSSTTNVLIANDDVAGENNPIIISESEGAIAVLNVLDNDTLNGEPVTTEFVTLIRNTTVDIILNEDGTVDVLENLTTGEYNFDYTICEIDNPQNCSTATVTLFIENTSQINIVANNDLISADNPVIVSQSQGALEVINVLDNDTFNGEDIIPNDVTITPIEMPDFFTLNEDGTIDVAVNTPSATYSFLYRLCERADPENCGFIANVSIAVLNSSELAIVANDDIVEQVYITETNGLFNAFNLLDNDTFNGRPVEASDNLIVTSENLPDNFEFNINGNLGILANTPEGEYNFTYDLCDEDDNLFCDSASVTVFVTNTPPNNVTAVDDAIDGIEVTESEGATNVGNVLDNDVFNNDGANLSNIVITNVSLDDDMFTLNDDGVIDVNANVPTGEYSFQYFICDFNHPNNCSSAIVRLNITNVIGINIDAVDDTIDGVNGSIPQSNILNVFDNDMILDIPVVPQFVSLTSNFDTTDYFVLNDDGSIDVISDAVPSETYSFTYTICAINDPNVCDTATVTITIE